MCGWIYLQNNIEVRSDLCFLVVRATGALRSQFLLFLFLFTVVQIIIIIIIIIIIVVVVVVAFLALINDWTEGRQEVCRLDEELDKAAVCHQFCSTRTANALPRKLWMGLETSTSEGKLFKL